jgi:DUF4097 and DUF4098 domain-containing protein YvlB
MKTIASLFVILLAATCAVAIPSPAQQETETKSFIVTKGGNLTLDTRAGSVMVSVWDRNEIRVTVEEISKEDRNELSLTQNGNDVRVSFTPPSGRRSSGKIRFTISLPAEFNLDLQTGGGNMKLDNAQTLTGKVRAQSGGGEIGIGNVNGEVELRSGGGNISAGAVDGTVDITSGGGNIRCGFVNGGAKIRTGGGNITLGGAGKDLDVSSGGGSIAVEDGRGNTAIRTGGGNVTLANASGKSSIMTGGGNISVANASGELSASTGGGNLTLKNVTGSIQGKTQAGNVYAEINPGDKTKTTLSTGTGDIEVALPASAKATILARIQSRMPLSSAGSDIICEFGAAEKSESRNEKTFLINGGGANIALETNVGKIRIRKVAK